MYSFLLYLLSILVCNNPYKNDKEVNAILQGFYSYFYKRNLMVFHDQLTIMWQFYG